MEHVYAVQTAGLPRPIVWTTRDIASPLVSDIPCPPDKKTTGGFNTYMKRYPALLNAGRAALGVL